ncbi:MAG TPA: hypothetical protein PK280_10795 [Planctomycetota bacterium]|nr:hypothetical protein [Planctomycetota bacterium]
MRALHRGWFLAAALALAAGGPAAALEVKLTVGDDAKVERKAGTVTSGVPFAKGEVKDLGKLSVSAGGKVVPAQFTKLAPWDDGSVRWALLDCQVDVPAGGKTELVVRDDGRNAAPAAPVKVADGGDEVKLATGALEVVIDKKKPGLLRVKLDGKEVAGAAGRGIVLHTAGDPKEVEKKVGNRTTKVIEYSGGKEIAAGAPAEVVVEQAGPLRATVAVRGKFPDVHEGLLGYTARISAFAGQKQVKVHLWIENGGAMGYHYGGDKNAPPRTAKMEWLLFDGLALELGLGLGAATASCEGAEGAGKFKVYQTCYWNKDKRKLTYNNYEVFSLKDFEFTVTGDGKELKKGERTDGVVEVKGAAGKLTTAIRGFWENYEKAVELDGDKLRLWLWPTEGQWPRARESQWAGLFDGELEKAPKPGLYYLPGAVHKGYELILDFSGRPAAESSAELSRPLFALASPEHYAASGAVPGIFAPPAARTGDADCDKKVEAWTRMNASLVDPASPSGFFAARRQSNWSGVTYFADSTYWYGWMDFGDVPCPARGPTSLQQDWLWVMCLGALRTGDVAFLRFGSEMARHRIDVDQLWSDRDMPGANSLQRGEVNFPAFHCYRLSSPPGVRSNQLAGTVLYYLLTGEPKALEACRRNAAGLKVAWEQVAKTKPWAGPQGDMAANGWAIRGYVAMHALTGEKAWLDEALGLFRANVVPKWKALGPHLHAREQIASQDYTEDDIKYCYAVASLCLLHHATGDKEVLELIKAGCDKKFPENFFDAPLFLADLHAYAAAAAGKPEYAKDAVEHWIEASPESDCPPVFLPESSTWTREKAMHLQTGHILQYYFWKQGAKK